MDTNASNLFWYMAQGGRPIPAAEWRGRAPPDLFCREGDEAWSAFDPANPPAPIHERKGWVVAHHVSKFR